MPGRGAAGTVIWTPPPRKSVESHESGVAPPMQLKHDSASLRSAPMNLTSVFEPDGRIPPRYTCEGRDDSPALRWSDVPDNVKSFVVIVNDPDAPGGTFVHWIVYDLPPEARALPEGVPTRESVAGGRHARPERLRWRRLRRPVSTRRASPSLRVHAVCTQHAARPQTGKAGGRRAAGHAGPCACRGGACGALPARAHCGCRAGAPATRGMSRKEDLMKQTSVRWRPRIMNGRIGAPEGGRHARSSGPRDR